MASSVALPARGRSHLWRWAIALVATILLVVSGSGLVVFAQSGTADSRGPAFVPADAGIYLEARLDLPAGQDEALAQMLTAFPGFADAGSFGLKVDEAIAGLTAGMGLETGEVSLVGDVLTGEIGLALGDLEAALMGGDDPAVLIGASLADAELATQLLDTMTSYGGVDEEPYGETTILVDPSTAIAIHGDWLLVSNDVEQVKAAIDVLEGSAPSLADDADFQTAFARVPSGRLGSGYVDLQAFGSLVELAGMAGGMQVGMELPVDELIAALPREMVMFLAATDDRMTLEVDITPGDMPLAVPVGESQLAGLFPADTQLYLEARELGATVEGALNALVEVLAQGELLPDDGSMGEMNGMGDLGTLFGEESPFTSILGAPLPEFLDFVSDASVGAGLSSDGLWLGIAAEVTDEAVAEERVDNLISLVRLLAGDPAESGIEVLPAEMVGDAEVTRIMLPLEELAAESGLGISLGDSISVAVADGHLLLGLGDFVQSALTGDGSDSLGASAGYVDALGEDTVNSGVVYVNVSSLLAALDPMLSMMMPEWSDMAPYAAAIDRLILVGTSDDDVMRTRLTTIVNQ